MTKGGCFVLPVFFFFYASPFHVGVPGCRYQLCFCIPCPVVAHTGRQQMMSGLVECLPPAWDTQIAFGFWVLPGSASKYCGQMGSEGVDRNYTFVSLSLSFSLRLSEQCWVLWYVKEGLRVGLTYHASEYLPSNFTSISYVTSAKTSGRCQMTHICGFLLPIWQNQILFLAWLGYSTVAVESIRDVNQCKKTLLPSPFYSSSLCLSNTHIFKNRVIMKHTSVSFSNSLSALVPFFLLFSFSKFRKHLLFCDMDT